MSDRQPQQQITPCRLGNQPVPVGLPTPPDSTSSQRPSAPSSVSASRTTPASPTPSSRNIDSRGGRSGSVQLQASSSSAAAPAARLLPGTRWRDEETMALVQYVFDRPWLHPLLLKGAGKNEKPGKAGKRASQCRTIQASLFGENSLADPDRVSTKLNTLHTTYVNKRKKMGLTGDGVLLCDQQEGDLYYNERLKTEKQHPWWMMWEKMAAGRVPAEPKEMLSSSGAGYNPVDALDDQELARASEKMARRIRGEVNSDSEDWDEEQPSALSPPVDAGRNARGIPSIDNIRKASANDPFAGRALKSGAAQSAAGDFTDDDSGDLDALVEAERERKRGPYKQKAARSAASPADADTRLDSDSSDQPQAKSGSSRKLPTPKPEPENPHKRPKKESPRDALFGQLAEIKRMQEETKRIKEEKKTERASKASEAKIAWARAEEAKANMRRAELEFQRQQQQQFSGSQQQLVAGPIYPAYNSPAGFNRHSGFDRPNTNIDPALTAPAPPPPAPAVGAEPTSSAALFAALQDTLDKDVLQEVLRDYQTRTRQQQQPGNY